MAIDDTPSSSSSTGTGSGTGPAGSGTTGTGTGTASGDSSHSTGRDAMFWVRLLVFFLVLLYLVLFVVMNTEQVEINFLFVTASTSLVFALALVGVLGFLLGAVVMSLRNRHR